jgi:hypothetical protein
VQVAITAFQAVSPTHIHIARTDSGGAATGRLLREGAASFELTADKTPSTRNRRIIIRERFGIQAGDVR